MAVVVLSTRDRGDGQAEVTMAQDGCRFTITVPFGTLDLPEAPQLLQIMADMVCAEQARLREITKPGGPL